MVKGAKNNSHEPFDPSNKSSSLHIENLRPIFSKGTFGSQKFLVRGGSWGYFKLWGTGC